MDETPTPLSDRQPRDAANWAQQASSLKVSDVPTGALNINVEGRQGVGPLQGFGQMWQKTYRIQVPSSAATPIELIRTWKEQFPSFWPKGNRFFAPLAGIAPGEVALIKMSMPGGMPLSTGVMVLYADEESFTLMTPQGHMFAGWITFSAHEEEDVTIAQAQVLLRANDPLYEVGFRLGAYKAEDVFWQKTLTSLGKHFGADTQVQTTIVCVDPKMQWSHAKNVWHNAAIRTTIHVMTTPLRWMQKKVLFRKL